MTRPARCERTLNLLLAGLIASAMIAVHIYGRM